jgi:hypothetical protein
MRRSRQERASSGSQSRNIAAPSSYTAARPQIGLTYRQVSNTDLSVITWAASAVASDKTLTFTPSANMIALFDEYVVKSATVRFHYATSDGSKSSYGHAHICCFDPTGSTTAVDYNTILSYRNSDEFFLRDQRPIQEYKISNCTHLTADGVTLLTDPIKTDTAWTVGHIYIAPIVAATETIYFTVEYQVVYSKPRDDNL